MCNAFGQIWPSSTIMPLFYLWALEIPTVLRCEQLVGAPQKRRPLVLDVGIDSSGLDRERGPWSRISITVAPGHLRKQDRDICHDQS